MGEEQKCKLFMKDVGEDRLKPATCPISDNLDKTPGITQGMTIMPVPRKTSLMASR